MTTSRQDRRRQETLAEIRGAARQLLATKGPEAVTINAVAREVGMSGPALYHYFAGYEELAGAVTADVYRELTAEMETARDAHDTTALRLLATCRALRAWATSHPSEFRWIFASPIPPPHRQQNSEWYLAGQRFGAVFLIQVAELWRTRPFPVPDHLDPSVHEQLREYAATHGDLLPPGALHVVMNCWIRLYGLVCMEVLNQLDFAYTDLGPVFEECLRELCPLLGLEYVSPVGT
jgi:AcrR family transcriptional regulator